MPARVSRRCARSAATPRRSASPTCPAWWKKRRPIGARALSALSDPTSRLALSPSRRPIAAEAEGAAKTIEDYVLQQLPTQPDRQVRAAVFEPSGRPARRRQPPFDTAVIWADERNGLICAG